MSRSAAGEDRPVRVLHVVGKLNRGGLETWLVQVLNRLDRDRVQCDVLVHTADSAPYDDDVRGLGSRILRCSSRKNPARYVIELLLLLRRTGPYDVVHCHTYLFSGLVVLAARIAGVRIRIVHSRTNKSLVEKERGFVAECYGVAMRILIDRLATHRLAVSDSAGVSLFGRRWLERKNSFVMPSGIDLSLFNSDVDKSAIRSEMGFPAEAIVIGHVGRFSPVKNHSLLIEILAKARSQNPRLHLLLVGDGELRPVMEEKVRQVGLDSFVVFAGSRDDVPTLMRGVMDVFVFPSLFEGYGRALVEADISLLPCLFSTGIPEEASSVLSSRCVRVSTFEVDDWVDALLYMVDDARVPANVDVSKKHVDIDSNIDILSRIYS